MELAELEAITVEKFVREIDDAFDSEKNLWHSLDFEKPGKVFSRDLFFDLELLLIDEY